MRRVTTAELIRNFGTYSDIALSEPVIITKNGRERLVLLSVDQYNLFQHISDADQDAKTGRASKDSSGHRTKRRTDP